MKHTHVRFSFGKRVERECTLGKACEAYREEHAKPEYKIPEGSPPTPAEMKERDCEAKIVRILNKNKMKHRPKPERPARIIRYKRIGPFGTEQSSCLDHRLD